MCTKNNSETITLYYKSEVNTLFNLKRFTPYKIMKMTLRSIILNFVYSFYFLYIFIFLQLFYLYKFFCLYYITFTNIHTFFPIKLISFFLFYFILLFLEHHEPKFLKNERCYSVRSTRR